MKEIRLGTVLLHECVVVKLGLTGQEEEEENG